jgi:hypothetical protein
MDYLHTVAFASHGILAIPPGPMRRALVLLRWLL